MIRRFCLHVRANKLQHNKGIWLPILYSELFKDDTILVQGWIKDPSGNKPCWHAWCETAGGNRVDPHMVLLDMDEIVYKLEYTTDKPDDFEQDTETVEMFELLEKDPKEFWKKQSSEIKSFRSKMFSFLGKNKF